MNKQDIEKSLKRYLKKKMSYTFSLLIVFLITGGFANANELNKDELILRVKSERERIEKLLQENYRQANALEKENLNILKEADFYAKPTFGSMFAFNFWNKEAKSIDKEWKGSVRQATEYDVMRMEFNVKSPSNQDDSNSLGEAITFTNNYDSRSSGWLNSDTNYGNNANTYDVEAKLFILPVVKAPVVKTPTAPVVSFVPPVAPTELKIDAPAKIDVNIGAISVTAPTLTAPTVNVPAAIASPTLATVKVNEPNISITIGSINVAGPTGLALPSLSAPGVSVAVSPNTPPSIVPPDPQVNTPTAPEAPNFTSYVAPGGNWLSINGDGGKNVFWDPANDKFRHSLFGFNNFSKDIYAAANGAIASKGTQANIDEGTVSNLRNIALPLFGSMNLKGNGAVRGQIYAYRDAVEAKTGYKNITSTTTILEYTPQYYSPTNGGLHIEIAGSAVRPGYTPGTVLNNEISGQKNRWLLTNHNPNPVEIQNIDFKLGGLDKGDIGENGVVLVRNDRSLTIKNSSIELLGKTTILRDILHGGDQYQTSFGLENVDIRISGDENTLYDNVPYSDIGSFTQRGDLDSVFNRWGEPYRDDGTGKQGVFGKTNLGIDTKKNTIFYIEANSSYRWNGYIKNEITLSNGVKMSRSHATNPEALLVYTPLMGRVRYENKTGTDKGNFYFNGSGNVGAWVNKYTPDRTKYSYAPATGPGAGAWSADEVPIIDLGKVYMNGDKNVGIYLASSIYRPDSNGIFQGKLPIDFQIGTSLKIVNGVDKSNELQLNAGNTDGNNAKSSGNVALYVASGQRKELTVANGYFPATTDLKAHLNTNRFKKDGSSTIDLGTGNPNAEGIGTAAGTQVGYPDLNTPNHAIKDLEITEYRVDFGKYSKDNIAVVARNGSVVIINPSSATITDGQNAGTADGDRAEGTIIGFAEGIWFNPRPAVKGENNGTVITSAGQGVVTDGRAGQKYVPQFGSSILIKKPLELGSKKAVAVFAKDGAKIETKSITIYGADSTGAFSSSTLKWNTKTLESDANKGGGTSATSNIKVDGDITLTNGSNNKGLIALNINGDGASVELTGKLNVKGLGAFAKGTNTTIEIKSVGSSLESGNDGSLVALDGGKIKFAGGTITHNIAGDKLPFYSANGSQLIFTGATTVNISKGLLFFGEAGDFTAATSGTSLYNGMQNITVNLKGHGVNLGVFKNVDAIWDGTDAYLNNATNGLKNIPKVNAINTNDGTIDYWYKTSLDGGKLTIKTDINRDSISSGSTKGDGFNDIVMERKQVILEEGKTVTSTQGKGMFLGSNTKATSNTESGYTIKKGKFNISNGTNSTTAAYVNFGHIITEKNGADEGIIQVSKGVGAYGVNGSKLINKGTVKIDNSNSTDSGIALMALAKTEGKTETYGIAANKAVAGAKWIEIENKGKIDIIGDNAIAIYAKNNHTAAATRNLSTIHNEAAIELGDSSKAIVIQTNNTEGATLTLKDSGTNQDIKVGKNSIGVYAEYSDIKFDGNYGIAIKDSGVALQAKGNGKIEQSTKTDTLNVEYTGTKDKTAMAMGYNGTVASDTFTNKVNLKITNTGSAKTLVGLYAEGRGTLTNQGDITSEYNGTYGILSKGVDIVNSGVIKVGDGTSVNSNAVGIYAENASVTTNGDKIVMQGNGNTEKPIGIYAKDSSLTTLKEITLNKGSSAMLVDGKKAIGAYLEANNSDKLKLVNNSDISLTASANKTDRRIGLILKGARNTNSETNGKITVGKNNIGIYNEKSILTNGGTLEVKHSEDNTQNIGIHNTGNGFKFNVVKMGSNPGLVDVEGYDGTVGISAATTGTDTGDITFSDAQIKVKATNMSDGKIPLGVYAKGNNITISSTGTTEFTVSPNAVGMYLEGNNTSKVTGSHKYNLSSENTKDRVGIGTYFKDGAYATTTSAEKIEITSSTTATNTDGPIRPIALYYGANSTKNEANLEILTTSKEVIGMYGKGLSGFINSGKIDVGAKGIGAYFSNTAVTNNGEINVNALGAYGLYLQGGSSNTGAKITASAKNSVGALITGKSAIFENKFGNNIISKAENSIGVYAEKEAEFKNSGTLKSEDATSKSIGVFADKAKVTNAANASIESKNVAIYAKSSSTVNNSGEIKIVNGSGIVANDKTTINLLSSGTINSTENKANGVIAQDKTIVNLSGTNISLTGDKSTAIYTDKNSTINLISGNVIVGKESLGIYTNEGTVNLKAYTGSFTLGEKSVAIYSKASTVDGGTLRINYNHNLTGVGIFYDGGTVINNTVVQHTGKNLVNILSKGADITNTANQNIQESSLGIYANAGEVTNSGVLTLAGDKSVGIYLDNNAKLKAIGTINGTEATNYKVGIYAKNGIIEGKGSYNFAVNNGVAMYLDDKGINNFTGTLNMSGNSVSGKRAVGIYTTPSTNPRNINTNINITGKDSIGILLSGDAINGSTVNYGGILDISSTSTSAYGIGALVQNNSTFNLSSTGKVKIGGVKNIGFYVQSGGTLQVSGGSVENTKEGIFAYLENGQLDFKYGSTPNINFLNVFVSGNKGSIQNATAITVGTSGLQAANGAKIINASTGLIKGNVDKAKALVGTGTGSKIENLGNVKLDGKESVAIYANDNASATSKGSVEVGENSVAYYAKDNGLINVSGTTKVGEGSTIFFVDKGRINYTGKDITLANKTTALTLVGNLAIPSADFNGKSITVGESGTGIYVTGDAEVNNNTIQNLTKINVGKSGNGIYINNDKNFQSNVTLGLVDEESIGILSTKNGNLTYSGKIDSDKAKVKGLVHTGKGDTINSGEIKLSGTSSIGAYAAGGNTLENTNKIEIAKGTATATAVGLYAKNQTSVKNSGTIKMAESAIGIYGENTSIINTGTISNAGKNNNGIYAKESNVNNSGDIILGDSSNGIYASSTAVKTITNSKNITVGDKESSAIFGDGKTGIVNTGGNIKVGSESVGLATKEGNITVGAATNFDIGASSTYIYTEKGSAINDASLSLSDYSVGIYTKNGTAENNANITVGKSLVSGGDTKISVGMATEKGSIENKSVITINHKHGVAMVANDGGTAINRAGGIINANGELSYAMQATKGSTLINEGQINVNGKDARGMAATNNSKIKNTGIINISGEKAQGIFVDFGSEVDNSGGTINVNSSTGIGILTGSGGIIKNTGTINLGVPGAQAKKEEGSSQLQAGSIKIKGPKAYIDNVEIQNSGVININGPLDLGTVKLGSSVGNIGTINAKSFNKGQFIVLPNATLGSNKDMYTIQYLGGIQNVPNNGAITAISHSATFIADIQKDEKNPNLIRIVMVRVPYTKLTQNTAAQEFGKGLEELYKGLSNKDIKAPEQKIFDALKMISDKDELGATFDKELRGNTYANVQRRMLDINETFTTSYENLKNSNLYARDRFKTGAIVTTGNSKDKNAGVENYKTQTTGLIVMKEKDFKTYGRSVDISLAFTETNFKFDYGSKEKVHSVQLGVGFENFITENNWKYSTRGEITLNRHNMKRKIHLSNGTYENKGQYWSETVEWKNKLHYEIITGGGITAGVFGTFNLGYGKFNSIKENGDGIELEIKSKDMYMIRPGVGADVALNYYTKGGKVSIVGTATAEYEVGKVYDGVNQAKIKKSSSGYYNLEKPKEVKDIYKVGAQVQYETNAGHKIGVGVTREEGSVRATKYGVNAVYKF